MRKKLHDRYGGQRRFGIAPCRGSANVLLFTAEHAWPHYENTWAEDGTFHYTGEAHVGDEIFDGCNGYIRDHVKRGKALRLFEGTRGRVTYAGEFVLDDVTPYHRYARYNPDGTHVQMIKFHLVRAERFMLVAVPDAPVGLPYRRANEDVQIGPVFAEPADPELVERNLVTHRRLQNGLAETVSGAGLDPLSPRAIDPTSIWRGAFRVDPSWSARSSR